RADHGGPAERGRRCGRDRGRGCSTGGPRGVRRRHRVRRARHRIGHAPAAGRAQFPDAGEGAQAAPRMCLAVEPMLTAGSPENTVLEDDWTVVTTDGSRAAHWEHSVALVDGGVWVLSSPDGGAAKLAEHGVTVAPLD